MYYLKCFVAFAIQTGILFTVVIKHKIMKLNTAHTVQWFTFEDTNFWAFRGCSTETQKYLSLKL